ncbi:response regulator [Desulfonatronum lacustre]|uniref:response regulator n=1 Tax=Desulfonatronum lacustre TaxID=66849 RepID=UPI00048BF6EE|nr:response regulator transcription factor [Desulfonatronum lacustre]SMP63849.1 two-component system, OmpR family, phosphate regulon response regulator PhoB [Desulfonatronum zhilinae]
MSQEKILIVEDEADILNLLEYHLRSAGYDIFSTASGTEALQMARHHQPDLVLLDLMLPGLDGFEVCRELKRDRSTSGVAVIMLTAKGEEVDKVVGLELGADDYVTKPFSPRELVLRVKAVLRRGRHDAAPNGGLWEREGLRIEEDGHRVYVDGTDTDLTATEFKLLAELIHNEGKVLNRDQLLNNVWGYQFSGYSRTVDTHIRRLRQKLGPYAEWVETIRGVGYRFQR